MNSTCEHAGEMQGGKVKVKVKVNAKWDQDRAKNSPEVFLTPAPNLFFFGFYWSSIVSIMVRSNASLACCLVFAL